MTDDGPGHHNHVEGTVYGSVFQAGDVHVTVAGPLVPRQLPNPTARFVGRRRELELLDQVLDGGIAIITAIQGAAGVGKTALALRWARRVRGEFPDGQLYANLRGFDAGAAPVDPAAVLYGFLLALGVPVGRIPDGLDNRSALYRSLVADRRMLLVLDNAHDVGQVRPLLVGGSGPVLVVTGRTTFDGLVVETGARQIRLGTFDTQDSRDLLASFLGPGPVDTEPAAVRELTALCGGLPLALAIIGAKGLADETATVRDLTEMVRAERNRLLALRTGDVGTDPTVVFSLSYRRLSPAASRLFRLLSVSALASFGPAAAASITAQSPAWAEQALNELATAHLVEPYGGGRYRIHDLLQAYAAELSSQADEDQERHDALQRLVQHQSLSRARAYSLLGTSTESAIPDEPGVVVDPLESYEQAQRWLELDRDSRDVKLDDSPSPFVQDNQWAMHADRLNAPLGAKSMPFMDPHGALLALANHRRGAAGRDLLIFGRSSGDDVVQAVEQELEYMREGNFYKKSLRRRMTGYTEIAWRLVQLGRVDEAVSQVRFAIWQADENQPRLPLARLILGCCMLAESRYADAKEALSTAVAEYTRVDARHGMATALCFLAVVNECAGNSGAAQKHAAAARTTLANVGHPDVAVVDELLIALCATDHTDRR